MESKSFIFIIFLLLPFFSIAQENPMVVMIDPNDPCCIMVEMNPEILKHYPPNWNVEIGELAGCTWGVTTYTFQDLDQHNSFRHCFPFDGEYSIVFWVIGGNMHRISVDITGCASFQTIVGFNYVEVDECCVELSVINIPPKIKWTINMGDGASFSNLTFPNDIVHYCYENSGKYNIQLLYETGSGSSHQVEITADSCRDVCNYWLCQTDYATAFGCSGSVTLSIDGVEVTIPFSQPITNATQGIPALVNEFQNIANIYGLTYVNVAPHVAHCPKSPDDPDSWGHFFLNSHVKFISLNAVFGCSDPQTPNAGWKKVNFNNDCD